MKRNYKSIHGDSPHPKIAQMSHILEVCTASDDYCNNTFSTVTGTCLWEGQMSVAAFHFFVPAVYTSTFPEWKWHGYGTELSHISLGATSTSPRICYSSSSRWAKGNALCRVKRECAQLLSMTYGSWLPIWSVCELKTHFTTQNLHGLLYFRCC